MSLICDNCGYANPDDSKNCNNCFKTITSSKVDSKKTKYKYEWPEKCSNCGAKVFEPSEKCEACGEKITIQKYRKGTSIPYFDLKLIAKAIAIIGCLVFIYAFFFSPSKNENTPNATTSIKSVKNTMADIDYKKIENGALKLDVSNMEDVTNFMNRTYDSFSRSPGDKNIRLFVYNYSDGSKLIIAMKPNGNKEGLVLDYYNKE